MRTPYAQKLKRSSGREVVHIFIDDAPAVNPKTGEPQDTRQAICSSRFTLDTKREKYKLTKDILGEDFLVKDGEIIGQMCGNCKEKIQQRFERGEMGEW